MWHTIRQILEKVSADKDGPESENIVTKFR